MLHWIARSISALDFKHLALLQASTLQGHFSRPKKITDATQPHHELGPLFCQSVSKAFARYDESSKNHVVNLYMKNSRQRLNRDVAREEMMKDATYTKKIKNFLPASTEVERHLEEAWTKIEDEDKRLKAVATLKGEGYLPFILSCKQGVRLGTRGELDNSIMKHVRKGCCQDPFGLDEMNVALDPDAEYSDYIRLRGTSQGESTNKLINRMTKEVGRQSADTADKRLWLWVTRFNLAKDEVLKKVLGIK